MQVEALKMLADYFLGLFAGAMCLAGVMYLVKSRSIKNNGQDNETPHIAVGIYRSGESEEIKRGRVAYTGMGV
jgi:hypothetical protein